MDMGFAGHDACSVADVRRISFDCPTPATSTSPVHSCAIVNHVASATADMSISRLPFVHAIETAAAIGEGMSLHTPEQLQGMDERKDGHIVANPLDSYDPLKFEETPQFLVQKSSNRDGIGDVAQVDQKIQPAEVLGWSPGFGPDSPNEVMQMARDVSGGCHNASVNMDHGEAPSFAETPRTTGRPSQDQLQNIEVFQGYHSHLDQTSIVACDDSVLPQPSGTRVDASRDETLKVAVPPPGAGSSCGNEAEARDTSRHLSSQRSNDCAVSDTLCEGSTLSLSQGDTQVIPDCLDGLRTPVETVEMGGGALPPIQRPNANTVFDAQCPAHETVVKGPLPPWRESNVTSLNTLWHPSVSVPANPDGSPGDEGVTERHMPGHSQGERRPAGCSSGLVSSGSESRLATIDHGDLGRGEYESGTLTGSQRKSECPPRYSSGDLSSAFSPPGVTAGMPARIDIADMGRMGIALEETSAETGHGDGDVQPMQQKEQKPPAEIASDSSGETLPPVQDTSQLLREDVSSHEALQQSHPVGIGLSPPGGTASRLLRAFTPFAFGPFKGGNRGQTSTSPVQRQQSPSPASQSEEYEKPLSGEEGPLAKRTDKAPVPQGAREIEGSSSLQDTQGWSNESQQSATQVQSLPSAYSEEKRLRHVAAGPTAAVNEHSSGVSHLRPRTPYNQFLSRLRHPSCGESISLMRRFVEGFPSSLERQEAAHLIHSFLVKTRERLLHTEAFAAAAHDPGDHLELTEGLERFLIQKLYHMLPLSSPEDEADDAFFERRIKCLQWVRLEHLDVSEPPNMAALELGCCELARMDRMRCPREKLGVVFNACKVIVAVIEESRKATGDSTPPSADDLLPLLIYMLIKANPPNLQSNIQFIAFYRHPSRLTGEEAYFFTHLCSAAAFIRNVGKEGTQLNMDPQEFQEKLRLAEATLDAKAAREAEERATAAAAGEQKSSAKECGLSSTVEALRIREPVTGAALAAAASALSRLEQLSNVGEAASRSGSTRTALDGANLAPHRAGAPVLQSRAERQHREQQLQVVYGDIMGAPRTFSNVRSVSDLRLGEIPTLLAEYRELLNVIDRAAAVLQQQLKLGREQDCDESQVMEGGLRR